MKNLKPDIVVVADVLVVKDIVFNVGVMKVAFGLVVEVLIVVVGHISSFGDGQLDAIKR